MRLSQAWLVASHDLALVRRRKGILYGLVAFPLAVAVGFPLLVGNVISRAGPKGVPPAVLGGLIDSFSFWFVVAAATLPVAIAAYSLVGEKIEKSLEPLLATPTTDSEILLGKALAAFLPTILAIWAGGGVFMAVMDRVTAGRLGTVYLPDPQMAILLFAIAPLACLFSIEVSILISARVSDVRTAQQYSGLLFLPFILIYLLGEIGVFELNTTHLLYIAGALVLVVGGLFSVSRQTFHRDEILTRWK